MHGQFFFPHPDQHCPSIFLGELCFRNILFHKPLMMNNKKGNLGLTKMSQKRQRQTGYWWGTWNYNFSIWDTTEPWAGRITSSRPAWGIIRDTVPKENKSCVVFHGCHPRSLVGWEWKEDCKFRVTLIHLVRTCLRIKRISGLGYGSMVKHSWVQSPLYQ